MLDLLSAAWDDRLTEASRARLEQLLALDDFAAIRMLTEFTRVHLDLEWLVSSKAAQRKALDAVARVNGGPVGGARRSFSRLFVAGLAAATVLLAVGAVWMGVRWTDGFGDAAGRSDSTDTPIVRPSIPVGRIFGLAGVRWGAESPLHDGQRVLEGQVVDLVEGSARVSMDAGAEMVLKAPCRLSLISGDMLTLDHGLIAVKVAKWAAGFKVRTNDLLITDLGTQFLVRADARKGSELHVLDGLVVASPVKEPALARRLRTSQAVRVNAEGGLDSIAFRREPSFDWLDTLRPLRSIELPNTGIGLSTGEKDRHWTITSGDAEFGPYPQPAIVCAANDDYGANDPTRSQWISVDQGTTKGAPVRSKYTFETTLDLTGFDPRTVRMTGLILADNGIEEIRLNGKPLPIAPWQDWRPGVTFFAFHTIEITSGFKEGKNVLSLVVVNETDLAFPTDDAPLPDIPNPMGLRVEWRAAGRPR